MAEDIHGCPTYRELEIVPELELFHDDDPLGVKSGSMHELLDMACEVMKMNPSWTFVEVRRLGEHQRPSQGVWRNPLEGRLIKSKVDG